MAPGGGRCRGTGAAGALDPESYRNNLTPLLREPPLPGEQANRGHVTLVCR